MAVRCRNATRRHSSSVKMAASLQHAPKKNSVCRSFLSSEVVKPTEIHRRMKIQYGDACLSLQKVYDWNRKFTNGNSSVTDSPRPGVPVAALSAKEFFSRGIHAFPKRWNTCMKGNGDYIEKMKSLCSFCVQ